MPTKYTREDFRDRALGTQRFTRHLEQRRRRPTLIRSTSGILITLPIVIFVMLFSSYVAQVVQSGRAEGRIEATVTAKEILHDDGEAIPVLTVEIPFEDEESLFGRFTAPQDVWDAVSPGVRVQVSYRKVETGAAIEILAIHLPETGE